MATNTDPSGWSIERNSGGFSFESDNTGAANTPVEGGQYLNFDGSQVGRPGVLIADGSAGVREVRAEFAMAYDGSVTDSAGIVFGWQDADNYYAAEAVASETPKEIAKLTITEVDGGAATELVDSGSSSGDIPRLAFQRCRIQVYEESGDTTVRLEARRDGLSGPYDLVKSHTISSPIYTTGDVGIVCQQAEADDNVGMDDIQLYWP